MKKDRCSMLDALHSPWDSLRRTPNGGYSTSIKKRVSRIENYYEIDGCTIG
ncbi:MAG TPA: hypothetical protein VMY06_06175 [Sedimentisphaerales bacterium]|nr:hypothetical protein [Sedimentisphaerales bacterium]